MLGGFQGFILSDHHGLVNALASRFSLTTGLRLPTTRHGYDANTQKHPTDLDASKLVFTKEQKKTFNKYVASTRIRAARNISGYALPCGATAEERAGVEEVCKKAFSGLKGDLKGTYYELGGMTDKQRDFLLGKGYLFQIPTARNLLMGAGAARSWPDNRGIFHNANQTALAWCNEEDHCRIISMKDGGDIPDVFARFCKLSEALKESATSNDTELMWNETLGFLGTCPSNLGTGLRASVMIKLEKFNAILEDPDSSHEVCTCARSLLCPSCASPCGLIVLCHSSGQRAS